MNCTNEANAPRMSNFSLSNRSKKKLLNCTNEANAQKRVISPPKKTRVMLVLGKAVPAVKLRKCAPEAVMTRWRFDESAVRIIIDIMIIYNCQYIYYIWYAFRALFNVDIVFYRYVLYSK